MIENYIANDIIIIVRDFLKVNLQIGDGRNGINVFDAVQDVSSHAFL